MKTTLLLLNFFYVGYGIWILEPEFGALAVIISFAVFYVILFGFFVRQPEYSIYAFVIGSIFLPQLGRNQVFGLLTFSTLQHANIETVIHGVLAFCVCIRIVRLGNEKAVVPKLLSQFFLMSFVVIAVSFGVGLYRLFDGYILGLQFKAEAILWGAPLTYSIVFLFGCSAFLKKTKQVEIILLIFLLAAVQMILEIFLIFVLGMDLPFGRGLHWSGRYDSFVWCDYTRSIFVSMAAISALFYFSYSRNLFKYIMALPLFLLPIFFTFQKAGIISAGIIVSLFVLDLQLLRYRTIWFAFSIGIALFFSSVILQELYSLARATYTAFYDVTSVFSRIGASLRGLDVFIFSFPLGIGEKGIYEFMASSITPAYCSSFLENMHASSQVYYECLLFRSHKTGPHNFYVYLLGSYGVLGAGIIYTFVYVIYLNWKRFIRIRNYDFKQKNRSIYYIQLTGYCVLAGWGVLLFFQEQTIYWLLLFFVYLTFFGVGHLQKTEKVSSSDLGKLE